MSRIVRGSFAAFLALAGLGVAATACDKPLRVGPGAPAATLDGGDAGEPAPGVILFGADGGSDAQIEDLRAPDSSVERAGWIVDPIPGVVVTTLAGGRVRGSNDGVGEQAQFNNPVNLALEPDGNLLVTDFENDSIRRVTPAGEVTTLIGYGILERPFGIAFVGGELYVQTDVNPTGVHTNLTGSVWRVDTATGQVRVIAADIGRPRGMLATKGGRLLLSDNMLHTVRELDPLSGEVSSVAGLEGSAGFADSPGAGARFNESYGVARMPNGDVVLADRLNHRIRRVTADGVTTTLAGDGVKGMRDGAREQARFNAPKAVAADAEGNVYVTDCNNHLVRRIGHDGVVKTVAGDGAPGALDGEGPRARFFGIEGIAVTPDGKTLYLADGTDGHDDLPFHRVRKIALP